ncbi:hypothetical protein ACSBR1_024559 [Camellia fascicularis]
MERASKCKSSSSSNGGGGGGKAVIGMICGSLVYYHCAYKNSSILTLLSDVFLVLISSLAILGLLFRHLNISVPVDPLEWQISQDTTNNIFACLANTVGDAKSVLRVAATGHDKRLFLKAFAVLQIFEERSVSIICRTASSGSFGSFDSNSMSLKSVNLVSLVDMASESEQFGTNEDKQIRGVDTPKSPNDVGLARNLAHMTALAHETCGRRRDSNWVPGLGIFSE